MTAVKKFKKNVFLNCPYDDNYRDMLLAIVFTIRYFGYIPRLTLENNDSGESRINQILELIDESKFGIHDLSRMTSSEADEVYRMNMPFELGIDFGCKRLKDGIWANKKILVLDKEMFRFHKAISDLSGSDIKHHDDEPIKVVAAVRDWFVNGELKTGDSAIRVWNYYNEFQAFLYDQSVEQDGHKSTDTVPIPEVIQHMGNWFKRRKQMVAALPKALS